MLHQTDLYVCLLSTESQNIRQLTYTEQCHVTEMIDSSVHNVHRILLTADRTEPTSYIIITLISYYASSYAKHENAPYCNVVTNAVRSTGCLSV